MLIVWAICSSETVIFVLRIVDCVCSSLQMMFRSIITQTDLLGLNSSSPSRGKDGWERFAEPGVGYPRAIHATIGRTAKKRFSIGRATVFGTTCASCIHRCY